MLGNKIFWCNIWVKKPHVRVKRDDWVIIVDCFIDNQPIWRLLTLQNRRTEVPLRPLADKSSTKQGKKLFSGKIIKKLKIKFTKYSNRNNGDLETKIGGRLTNLRIQLGSPCEKKCKRREKTREKKGLCSLQR